MLKSLKIIDCMIKTLHEIKDTSKVAGYQVNLYVASKHIINTVIGNVKANEGLRMYPSGRMLA